MNKNIEQEIEGIIQLSSKARTSLAQSTSNFNINLGYTVNASKLVIDTINIPHTYTNINEYNNTFTVITDGSLFFRNLPITITQYDLPSLLGAISTAASSASGLSIILAVDTANGFVITRVTAGHTAQFFFNSDIANMLGYNQPINYDNPSGLYTILANPTYEGIWVGKDNWQVSMSLIVTGLQEGLGYVGSQAMLKAPTIPGQYSVLATIPVETNPVATGVNLGTAVLYDIYRENWAKVFGTNTNLNSFSVSLLDDRNRVMDLQGKDMYVTVAWYL
jgi:hypothetical protein